MDPSWDFWFNSTEASSSEVGSTAIFPGLHADVGRLDSVPHLMLDSSTNKHLLESRHEALHAIAPRLSCAKCGRMRPCRQGADWMAAVMNTHETAD